MHCKRAARVQRPGLATFAALPPMRLALPAVASTSDGAPSSRREPRWWTGWAWGRGDSRAAAAPPSLPPPAPPEPTSPLPPAALPAAHPIEIQPHASTMHHAAAPTDPMTLLEWHGEQCWSREGLPYRRSSCTAMGALVDPTFSSLPYRIPCTAEADSGPRDAVPHRWFPENVGQPRRQGPAVGACRLAAAALPPVARPDVQGGEKHFWGCSCFQLAMLATSLPCLPHAVLRRT